MAHAEEFPRAETAGLVGQALDHEIRRARWQALLVAAGVTCLALAFPSEFVFGRTVELVAATARGSWSGPHLLSQSLAALLHALGMRAEPAWFLLAALGFGASTWVLLDHAARTGTAAGPRLLALGALVVTPVAWLAATTPSAAGLECFGACFLFTRLQASPEAQVRPARAAGAWLLAALLHAWNALLLPAAFLACGRRSWPQFGGAFAAWLVLVFATGAIEGQGIATTLDHLWRTLLAGGSGGPGPLVAWIAACVLGLGGGAMGWLGLYALGPAGSGGRPPAWVLVFGAAPLVVLGLGGVVTFDVPCVWLLPAAYSGMIVVLESRRISPLFLLVVLGLIVAFCTRTLIWVTGGFQAAVERAGRADLVVVTSDPRHVHLLEQRYGLATLDVSRADASESAARAAFLAEVEARIADLRARGRTVVYDPDALSDGASSRRASDRSALAELLRRAGVEPLR